MANKKEFDFLKNKKVFFIIPIAIAVITIITALVIGVPVDIEFKGGTMLTYSYDGTINTGDVKSEVEKLNLGTVGVTTGSAFGSDMETVQISFASDSGLTADVQVEVTDNLQAAFTENNLVLVNSQDVNPSSGFSFFLKCFVAVAFSFVLLIIYIAFSNYMLFY